MKKLKSKRGETVAETLCAVLMISMVFLFLAGSIVTAARVNKEIAPEEKTFQQGVGTSASGQVTLNARFDWDPSIKAVSSMNVTIHRTGNGYVYYEYGTH